MCQNHLANEKLPVWLEKVDAEMAKKVQQGGCVHCGGKLHQAKIRRKPRGMPQWEEGQGDEYRASYCCDQDGCRKRHTPPSVRFLGRKVYWGPVVVLVSAVRHGITPQRLQVLRESLKMDRRTVERWRQWWLNEFVKSQFWQAARARFMPALDPKSMPGCLCKEFGVDFGGKRLDRLLELLKFISPITTGSIPWDI